MSTHHSAAGSTSEGAVWEVKKGTEQGDKEALRELSRSWYKDGDPSKGHFNQVYNEANARIDAYNKTHSNHQLNHFELVDEHGNVVNDAKSAKGIKLGDTMEARTLGNISQTLKTDSGDGATANKYQETEAQQKQRADLEKQYNVTSKVDETTGMRTYFDQQGKAIYAGTDSKDSVTDAQQALEQYQKRNHVTPNEPTNKPYEETEAQSKQRAELEKHFNLTSKLEEATGMRTYFDQQGKAIYAAKDSQDSINETKEAIEQYARRQKLPSN